MTRSDFTILVGRLIIQMQLDGEKPILDYALRSTEEQIRLYAAHKSKCDGVKVRSRHQDGLAVDIYLMKDGKIDLDKNKAIKYHKLWETWGGDPMIEWDQWHFQVSR